MKRATQGHCNVWYEACDRWPNISTARKSGSDGEP